MKIETYVLERNDVDMFITVWNNLIIKYGQVTVWDLFDNAYLLGFTVGAWKYRKYQNVRYGWTKRICEVNVFQVEKGIHNFHYVLNLPDAKRLD